MNSNDYFKQTEKTESKTFRKDIPKRLLHGAIGCVTESGELLDIIKRRLFYKDYEVDSWAVREELGDILWYMSLICIDLKISFEDLMNQNIKKLAKRYPKGFFEEIDSYNRNYDCEEKAANE